MTNNIDDPTTELLKVKIGDIILSGQVGGICKVTVIDDRYAEAGFLVRLDAFSNDARQRDLMYRVQADMIEYLELDSLSNRTVSDALYVPDDIVGILNDWSDSYTIIDEDTYLIH